MLITAKPTNYIYPPRTTNTIPIDQIHTFAKPNWIGQLKYNDTRIVIKINPGNPTEIWNRHKNKLNYTPTPELQQEINTLTEKLNITTYTLLDGGLLNDKHTAIKNTIAIWDILVHNGQHQLGTKYIDRYNTIKNITTDTPYTHNNHTIGLKITNNIIIPENITPENWMNTWNTILEINKPYKTPLIEGLVIKDQQGTLERGMKPDNNSTWMIKSRVQTGRHNF